MRPLSHKSVALCLDDYDLTEFTAIAAQFGQRSFEFVVTPNVDHLLRLYDDRAFRELYTDAGHVLLDSRVLAYMLRLTKGIRARVCPGSDLTPALLSLCGPEDRVVLIGGREQQAQRLRQLYGLRNLMHYDPPMGFIRDEEAVERCLRFVEAQSPFRFCFLAIGSPQQEQLARALKHRGATQGLGLCVGASINFLTGLERRAPRWMQRVGLEWLFRLLQDPGRLARRYLLRGPRVFALLPRIDFVLRRSISSGAGI
jgi:N-acetylglucosaminyldiphosphoundecaprenol N-acetyl-beta-D-mannosaminyltransferase